MEPPYAGSVVHLLSISLKIHNLELSTKYIDIAYSCNFDIASIWSHLNGGLPSLLKLSIKVTHTGECSNRVLMTVLLEYINLYCLSHLDNLDKVMITLK